MSHGKYYLPWLNFYITPMADESQWTGTISGSGGNVAFGIQITKETGSVHQPASFILNELTCAGGSGGDLADATDTTTDTETVTDTETITATETATDTDDKVPGCGETSSGGCGTR